MALEENNPNTTATKAARNIKQKEKEVHQKHVKRDLERETTVWKISTKGRQWGYREGKDPPIA